MNKEELIRLFNREQRIEITSPGIRREVAGGVIRHISLTAEDGCVLYSELDETTADEAIREQLAYYKQLGQSFEWKLYDYDKPADLKDRLQAHGFEIGDPEALMVMELDKNNSLLASPVLPSIRPVTDPAGIDEIMEMEDRIWGWDHTHLGERLKHDLEDDPGHLRIYAAYDGGTAVSAAWMYLHQGTSFGSLWGGSTLPEYRHNGLYTSLIAVRAQDAWKQGYRLLMVDASPMSRPILEARGFQCLGYSYPCVSPK